MDEDARIVWVTRDDQGVIVGVYRHEESAKAQDLPGNAHSADPLPLFEDDAEVVAFVSPETE